MKKYILLSTAVICFSVAKAQKLKPSTSVIKADTALLNRLHAASLNGLDDLKKRQIQIIQQQHQVEWVKLLNDVAVNDSFKLIRQQILIDQRNMKVGKVLSAAEFQSFLNSSEHIVIPVKKTRPANQ